MPNRGRTRAATSPGRPAALVATKLRPPSAAETLIDRSSRTGAEPPARVVVVQAPAGYGKTSLLVQWMASLEARGVRAGWLTLDEDDNQPPRLLLHLAAALYRDAPARDDVLSRVVADLQLAPGGILRILDPLPASAPAQALFLDEFEHLVDEDALGLVRRLIERLPEAACLVLASRTAPAIGLGRLRVGGRLREIGVAELRFGEVETRAFFASRGSRLAAADVAELLARTEGWPAALQLSALAIAGRADASGFIRNLSGSYADVADYLAEDVLDRQDEPTERFLLETSILRRLCPELCDAVTGRRNGRAMLDRLAAGGLFVSALDGERRWYRYHPLFAKFLQSRLGRRAPAKLARLHRAAARWLARHELPLEAVHHALAAGDFLLAGRLMDTTAKELNRQGLFSTVVQWARELPASVLDAHPAIRAAAAWAHLFHRDFDAAERELARIARIAKRRPLEARVEDDVAIVAPIMAGHRDRIAETLELSRERLAGLRGTDPFNGGALRDSLAYGLVAAGRLGEARALLAEARADHARSGSLLGSVYTLTIAGSVEAIEGCLGAAAALYEEAEALAGRGDSGAPSPLAAIPLGYHAELLYERDELEQAERRIERHLALAVESAVVDMVIAAYLAAARIPFARGAPDDALRVVREAELTGLRREWPRLVAAARWERLRFAVLAGDLADARVLRARIPDELVAAEEPPLRPHAGETEAQQVGELRWLVRSGEARRAIAAIASERRRAESAGRAWRGLRLRILEAEAASALGERAAALRTLREALRSGARERFVRSFVDEGAPILRLVRAIRDSTDERDAAIPRDYLAAILGEAESGAEAGEVAPPVEDLSRREREILELVAEGGSNRDLARRLFVSENTVKFHLKAIFAKLGVSNRVQAIALARRAGVLH